jgi:hypothetical protein
VADRRNNANDGLPRDVVSVAHAFADDVLIGPILAGKILVDDGHWLTAEAVLVRESAAANHANAHGFKVARADGANVSVRPRIAWRGHAPFDVERRGTAKTAERQGHPGGSGFNARRIGKLLKGAVEKSDLLCGSVVLTLGQGQGSSHQSVGTETDVDILQFGQALEKDAGAGEQNQRQGELRHDQRAAEAMPAAASFSGAAALLQILLGIDERDLPGRRGAKNNGRSSGEQGGEKKNVQIYMNVNAAGKVFRRKP